MFGIILNVSVLGHFKAVKQCDTLCHCYLEFLHSDDFMYR